MARHTGSPPRSPRPPPTRGPWWSRLGGGSGPPIRRASSTDRAFLAMGRGGIPEHIGMILRLGGPAPLDLTAARRLLVERLPAVPRLRQRLVPVPFGCGAPIWVDDPDFEVGRHLTVTTCPAPGDDSALYDLAVSLTMTRLPGDRPPWRAVLVEGLAAWNTGSAGGTALVLVLDHVLVDGVGAVTMLGRLADPDETPQAATAPEAAASTTDRPHWPPPEPPPGMLALALDNAAGRLRGLRRIRRTWRELARSMRAAGGVRPPAVGDCSLLQPVGPARRIAVVSVDREPVRAAAHRLGGTTNDAVLAGYGRALSELLTARGERLDQIVVTVPVSGRRGGTGQQQTSGEGNLVAPAIVAVPTTGDPASRVAAVAAAVRACKDAATGPPPIAVLGPVFRMLAALGGYRWYMAHQRRLHTLVTHVRAPQTPLSLHGRVITETVAIPVGDGGNTSVYAAVVSYRDRLTVSLVVDPDLVDESEVTRLADDLRADLAAIVSAGRAVPATASPPPGAGTAGPPGQAQANTSAAVADGNPWASPTAG